MAVRLRSYSELIKLPCYNDRLQYLRTFSKLYDETFGANRYLNQAFYHSAEWLRVKRDVIVRDNGKDLGIPELDILGRITVHHLNPITLEDIVNRNPLILDPENLICCSHETHMKIHYAQKPHEEYTPRSENDTCPWRR